MARKVKSGPRHEFDLEQGNGKVLDVVGQRPDDQPYIWIGDKSITGEFFGTLHESDMRELRDAIDRALGDG